MSITPPPAPPSPPKKARKPPFPFPWLVIIPAFALVVTFLAFTPRDLIVYAGNWLLAKPYMVGYAVCHQIPSHSFIIGDRALPLCARCTGTFMGALVGFFGQAVVLRRKRVSEFPPPLILVVLVLFTMLWAGDGLNSYMGTIVRGPHLYRPLHELRLLTGALNGLTMSALVWPAFNVTLWRHPVPEPNIRGLRDLGVLVLLELSMVGLVLLAVYAQWDWLLYPLAWLGALGVLALLTSVNTLLVLIVIQRENVVERWRDALVPLVVGFAVGMVQVSLIGAVRYTFTGTFLGLPLFG